MAESITLEQFKKWVKKNEKHTWSLDDMKGWREGSTHLIKYMDLGFDTRTMDIFRIKCRGMGEDFVVHTGDDVLTEGRGKNTLLDLLDKKLKEALNEREKIINEGR